MKSISQTFPVRLLSVFTFLGVNAFTLPLTAQEAGRASQRPVPTADPAVRAAVAAQRQQMLEEALALYRTKDPAAEESLFRTNHQQRGTFGWQIESAGKLTHMALALRQEYDFPGATAVALRALACLEAAGKTASRADAHQQAVVQEMTGFLFEEILREPELARAAYEKARQINPRSPRAVQGLTRLDEETTKLQRLTANR